MFIFQQLYSQYLNTVYICRNKSILPYLEGNLLNTHSIHIFKIHFLDIIVNLI